MKKINNNNLDVYFYIKEYIKEKGYCPTFREIQENTNYKSLASIREVIEKLAELKFIKVCRNENGTLITRTIKIIDNDYTKQCINELRDEYE